MKILLLYFFYSFGASQGIIVDQFYSISFKRNRFKYSVKLQIPRNILQFYFFFLFFFLLLLDHSYSILFKAIFKLYIL
jgi:hypothetical protein